MTFQNIYSQFQVMSYERVDETNMFMDSKTKKELIFQVIWLFLLTQNVCAWLNRVLAHCFEE
jgi:hypothetical protein